MAFRACRQHDKNEGSAVWSFAGVTQLKLSPLSHSQAKCAMQLPETHGPCPVGAFSMPKIFR